LENYKNDFTAWQAFFIKDDEDDKLLEAINNKISGKSPKTPPKTPVLKEELQKIFGAGVPVSEDLAKK